MEKDRRFGILSSCKHAFCLSCIRSWRKSDIESKRFTLHIHTINSSFTNNVDYSTLKQVYIYLQLLPLNTIMSHTSLNLLLIFLHLLFNHIRRGVYIYLTLQ